MRPVCFASAFALLLLGCSRPAAGGAVRHELEFSAIPRGAPDPESGEAVALALPDRPWTNALRMERWDEALRLIEREPQAIQQRPEVRYAWAAAAEKLGDVSTVLKALAGLERELPLLAARIHERRARAALTAQDAQLAFDYYGPKKDPESQLKFAEAQMLLGQRAAARGSVETLLAKLPQSRKRSPCTIEAPARHVLSELLPEGSLRARELRWLALQAPLCPHSEDADQRLENQTGQAKLTKSERAARARAFANDGRIQQTELELQAMARAPGAEPEPGTTLALRGLARYSARQELEHGAEMLASAAALNSARRAEWLYAAARSRTREGATDPAIALFDRVRKGFPNTGLAEQAEYQRARLIYSAGRFPEAVRAYDGYLARYGRRGRFTTDATDERAVAWVLTGNAAKAAPVFAELGRTAHRRHRARYSHLEAVAWLRAGQRARGEAMLQDVIREHPLSFAALAAAERLMRMGVEPLPAFPMGASDEALPANLLVTLPPEADFLHRVGLDREAELALAGVEKNVLGTFSGQGQQALCMLYQRFASAERCFRVGTSAASWDELRLAPENDRRWLWECVYPRPYAELVQHHAAHQGLSAELIYAVMRQESAFRPEVVSPAQAVGLLQIMPTTGARLAREIGLMSFDAERLREPPLNLRLGSRYLRKLLDVFDGNLALTVASYNAGPHTVLRWLEGGAELDLDLFVARIPYAETRGYVERVLGSYARYRYLTGGEAAIPRLAMALPTPRTDGVELY